MKKKLRTGSLKNNLLVLVKKECIRGGGRRDESSELFRAGGGE